MKQSHVKVIHPPPRLPLTRGHILRAAVIGVGGIGIYAAQIAKTFGGKVTFCGGISDQQFFDGKIFAYATFHWEAMTTPAGSFFTPALS